MNEYDEWSIKWINKWMNSMDGWWMNEWMNG